MLIALKILLVDEDPDRAASIRNALLANGCEVVKSEGGMSSESAKSWVKKLAQEGRYLRDVY